ncbi:MAG: T9SS type A sorting domain-containing protein [Bacteroidetes bacterium]|nr:T9SS type A sorting domain-containing protein [Bacteroidota bacterium]
MYVSGQGTGTYTVDWNTGNATVSLTASNACGAATRTYSASPSCREAVEITETAPTAQIHLYPNPADDKVTVSYHAEQAEEVSIEMKDVSGRIVYSSGMNAQEGENQSVIEVSQLSKGVLHGRGKVKQCQTTGKTGGAVVKATSK